ncbi:MAG TPA: hypothetical protein VJP45_13550 [Candidatus Limnocylindria bacterium]|nr:hypothetical protein [Candidatus Limnocylindria bacterium]
MNTTADLIKIELPFPTGADLALQIRVGPCRLRLTAGDGPAWIIGTYSDPTQRLPVAVRTHEGTATIAQRFEAGTLGELQIPSLDLTVSRQRPFALDLQAGASENVLDLGGLPLTRLVMKSGAGRFEIDFSAPNPAAMSVMEIGSGAGAFAGRRLANANFAELRLGSGAASCALDFSGELRRDARAHLDAGFAALELSVPRSTPARVATKSFASGMNAFGLARRAGAYHTPPALEGRHPLLEIDVSMAFGSLTVIAT